METQAKIIIHATGLELKMDQFSGPMDLLLHMIKENQLNIYDIPICEITEAYLGIIQRAQEIEYQVAGEFLVMASLLLYIKSRTLIPPDPDELQEGEEDPKAALVQKLLAYEEAKAAAIRLQEGELLGRDIFTRQEAEDTLKDFIAEDLAATGTEIQKDTSLNLAMAYLSLLRHFETRHINLQAEPINYKEFFKQITQWLSGQRTHMFDFSSLPSEQRMTLIQRMVLTILVFLELSKRGLIQINQSQHYGALQLDVLDPDTLKHQDLETHTETPTQVPEESHGQ